MLLSETTGDQMVLACSIIVGKIRNLCVASRVYFCFPQCVNVSTLRILVVRSPFVLVILMCSLKMNAGSSALMVRLNLILIHVCPE